MRGRFSKLCATFCHRSSDLTMLPRYMTFFVLRCQARVSMVRVLFLFFFLQTYTDSMRSLSYCPDDFPNISEFFRTLMTNCFLVFHTTLHMFLSHFYLYTHAQHWTLLLHVDYLRDRRHKFALIEKNSQLSHGILLLSDNKYCYWLRVYVSLSSCVLSAFIKRILYCIVCRPIANQLTGDRWIKEAIHIRN